MNNENNILENSQTINNINQSSNVNPPVVDQNNILINQNNTVVDNASNNYNNVDPISVVANLNKDEAMEEALSHTTQYSPFEVPKQEVNQEVNKKNNKSIYIFIGVIFAIMALFIFFLPQISNLFGWV